MKLTQSLLVSTLLAAFAAGAGAHEATPYPAVDNVATTKSRADVVAELQRAGATGYGEISSDNANRVFSVKSREQVRAEVLAAMASGELREVNGEGYINRMGKRPATAYATRVASQAAE